MLFAHTCTHQAPSPRPRSSRSHAHRHFGCLSVWSGLQFPVPWPLGLDLLYVKCFTKHKYYSHIDKEPSPRTCSSRSHELVLTLTINKKTSDHLDFENLQRDDSESHPKIVQEVVVDIHKRPSWQTSKNCRSTCVWRDGDMHRIAQVYIISPMNTGHKFMIHLTLWFRNSRLGVWSLE